MVVIPFGHFLMYLSFYINQEGFFYQENVSDNCLYYNCPMKDGRNKWFNFPLYVPNKLEDFQRNAVLI